MVDCTCPSLAERDIASAVFLGGLALGRLASPRPLLRGTAKCSDVVAHDSARHGVNLCAAFVQPAKEMGEPGRVRTDRIGGPATVGQIDQEFLDLACWLSIGPQDAERGFILGRLFNEKDGHCTRSHTPGTARGRRVVVWRLTPVGLRPPSVSSQATKLPESFSPVRAEDHS